MSKHLRGSFVLVLVLAGISARSWSQATNAAAGATTNAPGVSAPAGPAAVPLGNVVAEVVTDSAKIQEIQNEVTGDHTIADVERSLVTSTGQIDQRTLEDRQLLIETPTLQILRSAQEVWRMLGDALEVPKQTLAARVTQLDAHSTELTTMLGKWQATRAAARTAAAPADVLARIDAVLAGLTQASKAIGALRAQLLSSQNKVAAQDSRVQAELKLIGKAQETALSALFVRDDMPIWALGSARSTLAAASPVPAASSGLQELRVYLADKFPTAILHLLIFNGLAILLIWARRAVARRVSDAAAVQHAAQVFEVPIAMAAVVALLLSGWFYPLAPRLMRAGLGAAALIPAVIILRRLIGAALQPVLYAMVAAYAVDQGRYVAASQPLTSRVLFLLEALAATLFLVWLVRSGRVTKQGRDVLASAVRLYAFVAGTLLAAAAVVNALGYTKLSYLVGNATLASGYIAIILYAAVRVGDGVILLLTQMRPLSLLGMVQRHSGMFAVRASMVIRWLAFAYWLWETLEFFSIRTTVQQRAISVVTYSVPYGSLQLSLGPLILFGVTVWATVMVSRFARFILEEEVYPNLRLGPGVPYATSTLVHYVILVLGTLFALSAVKINLAQYSVLAGALGVGLGFGLQNIMNNFVSGLILLFERPIKVGDVIQVDTSTGTVESIGIRASVIRVTNGAEIIMPNGNLISNQVTNWTFSDRRRALEIPVAVAAKSDPQKVMSILVEAAKGHPHVLKEPPPQVLATNLTGAILNFELRAWTDNYDEWGQVRSELFLAVSSALARDGIEMA